MEVDVDLYNSFFLSVSSSEAHASRDHFFLSPNFHELWHGHNDCLSFTKVKWRWATLVMGWVTSLMHYLCLRWLFARASRPKPLSASFFVNFAEATESNDHITFFWKRKQTVLIISFHWSQFPVQVTTHYTCDFYKINGKYVCFCYTE